MRLLFLSFSVVPFGPNDLLYFQAAGRATDEGDEVLVSPFDFGRDNAPEYDALERRGARVHRRPWPRRPDNLVLRQVAKVRHRLTDPARPLAFIRTFRPDCVVISDPGTFHMTSTPAFVDEVLAAGAPIVTISQFNDEHAPVAPDLFDRARRLFGAAAATVFVSRRNLEVARRQLCLPLDRSCVLDNPPRLETLDPEPFPDGPARLAVVARLETAVKGQALVLDALSRPAWRSRDWRVSLCGSGPDERYLAQLVRFYDLADRVTLAGHVADVRRIWQEHQLLVLCSVAEGKPLALTEAMVCGRPAVVTDVGGNAELIRDGVTGFVAASPTVPAISDALERAWTSRARWPDMGRAAAADVTARLSPAPAARLLSLVRAVGAPGARSGRA